MDAVAVSKRLAYVLRHAPESIGLVLDEAGWGDVEVVRAGLGVTRAALIALVERDGKRRYTLSEDGLRIRAEQGHSVEVSLGHPAATPPDRLYHGTVEAALSGIFAEGLRPGARHDVHLSADVEAARVVGARRGAPVVLVVDARAMAAEGHTFARAGNGVWLVAAVPARYLARLDPRTARC